MRKRAVPERQVELVKRRGQQLGVRFFADASGVEGAVIEAVEPYGVMWCARLRAGDVVTSVRAVKTGHESTLASGYDAAQALRPAIGALVLRVIPRRWTAHDEAASRLQAGWLGMLEREAQLRRLDAAVVIQSHWRRCYAMDEVWDLILDRQEDEAAVLIQSHWRRCCAAADAWVLTLALAHLQAHARGFVTRLRMRRRRHAAKESARLGSGKRQRIRSPAFLERVEDEEEVEPEVA